MPKGKLIAIGGGEDKTGGKDVLNRFLDEIDLKHPVIGLVPTASNLPDEVLEDYMRAFDDLGIKDIITFDIRTREDANLPEISDKIRDIDGIIFTGGDQLKLSSILGGTTFLNSLREKYENKYFIIAGTSAGAACMSTTMIVKGSSRDALIKGDLDLTTGLGLVNNVIIDTHFTERGRFGRLIQAVAHNPSVLGIGLGEDTGVIFHNENEVEIIGSGLVIFVDGLQIKNSNIADAKDGEPLSIENVILHVLNNNDKFFIKERSLKID
jgi:cyanophycinase